MFHRGEPPDPWSWLTTFKDRRSPYFFSSSEHKKIVVPRNDESILTPFHRIAQHVEQSQIVRLQTITRHLGFPRYSRQQSPILIHDPVYCVRFLVRPSSSVLTLTRMV